MAGLAHSSLRKPRVSDLCRHTFGFGPPPARQQAWRRSERMTILVIVLLLLLVFGGRGWGAVGSVHRSLHAGTRKLAESGGTGDRPLFQAMFGEAPTRR